MSARPVFLNLLKIRLPVGAAMSIIHRMTGTLMVLAIPLLAYLLDLSLSGPRGFVAVSEMLAAPLGRLSLLLALWVLLHHLLAGARYLLIDMELGVDRPLYRKTAWVVLLGAPLLALLVGGVML